MCFQSTTSTKVDTPAPTAAETKLENLNADYAGNYAYPAAQNLSTMASSGLANTISPDYNSMYPSLQTGISTQQNNFNNLQSAYAPQAAAIDANATKGYSDLYSGKTSDALSNARFNYINEPMQKANKQQGDTLNSLASKGVLNSRVTTDAIANIGNDATNNIANRLSDAYTNDYGLASQTLASDISGQSSRLNSNTTNQSNLISQGMDTAYAPIQYGAQAQGASTATPLQWFNSATGQAQPVSDAWNQMANRRYGASGTTTTGTDNSVMNGLFGIGAAFAGRKVK